MADSSLSEQKVPARFTVRGFDIEVRGCRVVETDEDGTEHIQPDDENPQFYAVYRADKDGLMMWESDHGTAQDAFDTAKEHGVFEFVQGNHHLDLKARTLPEAEAEAKAILNNGEYGQDRSVETFFVEAIVRSLDPQTEQLINDEATVTQRFDPEPPHSPADWQSPALLGGLEENPGVWPNSNGLIVHHVDANSGWTRVTDTSSRGPWNQPDKTVRFNEPTDETLDWAIRQHPLRITLPQELKGHEGVEVHTNMMLDDKGFTGAVKWEWDESGTMDLADAFVELTDEKRVSLELANWFECENLEESVTESIQSALDWPNVFDLVTAAHGPVETFRTEDEANAEWEKEVRSGTRINMENGFSDETGTVENPTKDQAREAAERFYHVDERPATPDEIVEMGLSLRGLDLSEQGVSANADMDMSENTDRPSIGPSF